MARVASVLVTCAKRSADGAYSDFFPKNSLSHRRHCALLYVTHITERVGTAAKEFLNHVQNNQSQDGVVYVLFAHDFPDFFSGVAHTLHTEITRHKIREFFCPI